MLGYRQTRTRPCRNGPSCHYLRNGNCWFFHPTWHLEMYREPSLPDSVQMSLSVRSTSSIHYERPFPNYLKSMDFTDLVSQYPKEKKENLEPKTWKVGNKVVKLVQIQTSLSSPKAWFFKNSRHFNYFPDCQHQECSVCLDNFSQEQVLSVLLCNHAFHQSCIENWLKGSNNCPLCRKDFRLHEQFKKMRGYTPPLDHMKWQNISISRSAESFLSVSDYEDNYSLHFQAEQSFQDHFDIQLDQFDQIDDYYY